MITIIDAQKNLTTALTQSTISAQRHSERTTREANVSARRSRDVTEAVEKYKAGLEEALSKVKSLENTVEELQAMLKELGKPFPMDPHEQLWGAVSAVFKSWMTPRAIAYREINDIPEEWGTAVNV